MKAEQRLVASSSTALTLLLHMLGRENQYVNDYDLNMTHTGYLRTRSWGSTQTLAQECYVLLNVICTPRFIHLRPCVVLGFDLPLNLSSGTLLQHLEWQVPGLKQIYGQMICPKKWCIENIFCVVDTCTLQNKVNVSNRLEGNPI